MKITITYDDKSQILEEQQFGSRPYMNADFLAFLNTVINFFHYDPRHDGNLAEMKFGEIKIRIEDEKRVTE